MEILIVVLLATLSIFIIVRNFKQKASGGGCDCGSCSSHCAMYKNTEQDKKDN